MAFLMLSPLDVGTLFRIVKLSLAVELLRLFFFYSISMLKNAIMILTYIEIQETMLVCFLAKLIPILGTM